jgi:hypothetical protein
MDLNALKVGAKLLLEDGSAVQVVTASTDGRSVRVRYLDSPFSPDLVGTEADCTDFDILSSTDDGATDTPVRLA